MKAKTSLLVVTLVGASLMAYAKDVQTVVFKTVPEMHCNNCEKKITNNMRFEKGVKDIVTNLTDKTVTIKYDADKTTVDNLVKGFEKIHYQAIPLGQEADSVKTAGKNAGQPAGSSR